MSGPTGGAKEKDERLPENIPGYAAQLYDKLAREAVNGYYRVVAEEVANAFTSGRLLDVGTGPGYLVIELAKIRPRIEIDAVDLTPELIEIARRNAGEAGVRVNFEVGDAYHLRFEDERYDMVTSTGVLHSLRYPLTALKEWYRVLKAGGEVWVFDPSLILPRGEAEEWKKRLNSEELAIFEKYRSYAGPSSRAYTVDEVENLVRETSFTTQQVEKSQYLRIKLRK